MLTKKMYPQRSSRTKKYLEDYRPTYEAEKDDESRNKRREGAKWDKTDSECEFCFHLPYAVIINYICIILISFDCRYCSRDLDTKI